MIARAATPADLPRVQVLTDAEGWGYESSDLRRLLALCGDGFLVLIADDGAVGGALTVLPYTGAAWIGNVVVEGAMRGRGAGHILMEAAHHFCDTHRLAHVYLDAFPPAIGFYRALGYQDDGETHRWSLHVPSALPAASPRVVVLQSRDLDALVAADAAALDPAGTTHRRELLTHLMHDYPAWTVAHRDASGALDAWGMARPGSSSSELGPLGGTPGSAALVADALLARLAGGLVELSVPAANPHAERWLLAHGFDRSGWHLRMYRGARLPWNREQTWALGGLEKG